MNHDTLDNTDGNLRAATIRQNVCNSRVNSYNRTGFKGVHLKADINCVVASIVVMGRVLYLKRFPNTPQGAILAAECYDKAAFFHFGEFAFLNFPHNLIELDDSSAEYRAMETEKKAESEQKHDPKPKRAYHRKAIHEIPAQIPVQQAPNPNILQAEAKINELIELRMAAQYQIQRANQQLQAAQMQFQNARDEVARLEAEISYRQGIVNQMRGGGLLSQGGQPYAQVPSGPPWVTDVQPAGFMPAGRYELPTGPMSPPYNPVAPYPQYPPNFQQPVSSHPANNRGLYPDLVGGPDGALTGNAEETRQQEMRQRGY